MYCSPAFAPPRAPASRQYRRRLRLPLFLLTFAAGLSAETASAQSTSIAGTVTSAASSNPIPSAQVVVAGSTIGTTTDGNGRFRLSGLTGPTVNLEVRRIGYRPVRQTVNVGITDLRIAMTEQSVALDNVVITGTPGGQALRELGNAVTTVNAAKVTEQGTVNNVQQLLNGRSPGVFVNAATGNVGTGSRIRIRGASSLSLSNEPLIYVDGVRVNAQVATGPVNQAFGSSSISRVNDINPDDIESLEVIKGPAAATLYGTEASNGVIQIITKKGAMGKPRWNFSTKQGTNYFQNPEGRFRINWGTKPRVGGTAGQLDTVAINLIALEEARGTPVFQHGRINESDINTSGGSELFRYYAGVGLEDSEGMEPTNTVKRRTGRLNLTVNPNKTLDFGVNVGYTNGNITLPCEAGCGGRTLGVVNANVTNLLPLANGDPNPRRGWNSGLPEQYDRQIEFYQMVDRFTGGVQVNQQLTSWFKHRLSAGTDRTHEENSELFRRLDDSLTTALIGGGLGSRSMTFRSINNYTADYSASAIADFSAALKSTSSAGVQYYRNRYEISCAAGSAFPAIGITTVSATTIGRSTCHDIEEDATVGLYAQEQIGWKEKLYLTAALRADDNSAFGRNFDRVYYPKFSVSFIPIEGPMGGIPFLNALKLRAAYGESGKQPITFSALQTYESATGPGDVPTVTQLTIGNPDLGPERSKEIELGFDVGAFADRFGAEVTYYRKRTLDAILDRTIAPSIGVPGVQPFNAGSIRNSGLELLFRGTPLTTDRLGWDMTFSWATNTNKVEDLGTSEAVLELRRRTTCPSYVPGGAYPSTCAPVADFVNASVGALAPRHQVGYPIGSYFNKRIVSAEVNAAGVPINVMCDDALGGSIACASAPFVFLGRTTPRIEGAFSNTFTILRNIRVSALLDFKRDYMKVDGSQRFRCVVNTRCKERFFVNEFDPKLVASVKAGTDVLPDGYMNDASYTKLREVAIQYTLPPAFSRFGRFSRAVIGVAGRNLHTWTDYPGLDPEAFFLGGDRGGNFALFDQTTNPQATQWVVNLNISW